MVRTYQRKFSNSRNGKNHPPYLSYSIEDLKKAIELVQNGSLKLSEASENFNIPKSTLSRKSRNINCTQEKAGHPTLFSKDEEMAFIEYIQLLSIWGFPLDSTDLRVFAQKYLNKLGKTIYSLKDNMPGVDWARNFMIRHKSEISNRQASNISSERAKISPAVIDDFFSNYEKSIEGVSPDCLINYDETNLTDDPGNKKYLFKRGCKYPERVINNTKTSISLMFTGTADGQLLPVYVVYKADHLWDQWLEGGPEGTRYNRSKSGWFDSACFEDWFNTIIVPYAKMKPGRKVIIGDNLSSHFSQSVLQTCQELNIMFVCLPPKATHLLQPLDVAFYAPLKKYWRDVLTYWKKTEGFKHKTLAKSSFPKLLYKLQNKLTEKGSESSNIIAGFNKCGLYPVNSERPKSRLPQTNSTSQEEIQNIASSAIVEILQDMRNPTANLEMPKRKKKCNVPPGKSITAEDLRVEQTQPIKSRQNKRKNITREKVREQDFKLTQSIAGPSGLCKSKKQTTLNKENRGNESDTTDVSSQDEYEKYENKSKLITQNNKAVSSYISNKGKGKGKKSKLKLHNTNSFEKDNSEIINRLNATTDAKFKRKKTITKSGDSTTSVSDIMSVHSDSDLLDVNFDEHSSDINNWNDPSPSLIRQLDNSDEIKINSKVAKEELHEYDKTQSYLPNNIINDEDSHSEINTLPPMIELKDNFDDNETRNDTKKNLNEHSIVSKNKPISESTETFYKTYDFHRESSDKQDNESIPLFFFNDESGGEEVVVGDDDNNVSLISFGEKELCNNDFIKTDNKESNTVMDKIENEDIIENKENNTEIGKRLTIIKEESVENVFIKKKVILKGLKPIFLNNYINLPNKNNPKPSIKERKKYYKNSQEIFKALMDSD